MNEKDLVVIGGGPAGYVAAIHAAHLGAKVALIEKDKLGGTCLHRGCIPTKALTRSAEVLLKARRAKEFGVEVTEVRVNFHQVMSHKAQVISRLASRLEQLMKLNRIEVYKGPGRVLSPQRVEVKGQEIVTRRILIATGSVPASPPISGLDLPGVLSTDDILELKELPRSLIVIGGSYVGVELASIFSELGVRVTILEKLPHLLESLDEELVQLFTRVLHRRGVEVKTRAEVKAIEEGQAGLRVIWDGPEGEKGSEGQAVLVATGRLPYTAGLGLEDLGLKLEGKATAVNENLETSVKGLYAAGDVLGRHMLAHVAFHEGEMAAENALGRPRRVDYRVIPTCVFAQPELASVGLTEKEARDKDIPYRVSRFPFAACGRAMTMGELQGV